MLLMFLDLSKKTKVFGLGFGDFKNLGNFKKRKEDLAMGFVCVFLSSWTSVGSSDGLNRNSLFVPRPVRSSSPLLLSFSSSDAASSFLEPLTDQLIEPVDTSRPQ